MKKKAFIFCLTLFLLPVPIYAVQNKNMDTRVGVGAEESVTQQAKNVKLDQVEVVGQGNSGLENQVQVQVQNQGEEKQVQTQTEEKEAVSRGIGHQVRELAVEQAGQAVQNSLKKVGEDSGLGTQVRDLAMEQNQVQGKISQSLKKVKSRGRIRKFLFGPDPEALNNLENQMDENNQLITQLDELADQADETAQEQILSAQSMLEEQNKYLQQTIETELKSRGILSFLTNIFK